MLQITKCSKNHIIKKKSALIYKLYKILNKLNINDLSQNKNKDKNNLIITLQNGLSLKIYFKTKVLFTPVVHLEYILTQCLKSLIFNALRF